MSEINVVPYIDVMLVLLIIFMVTAPLLNQGVEIDLPQANAKPLPSDIKNHVIINVNQDGQIFMDYGENQDQAISTEQLFVKILALKKYQPNIKVLIGGDTQVDYGKIVAVMGLLQQAGIDSIGMLTDPPEQ